MNEQNLKLEAVKKRCNIAAKITGIIQTLVIIGAVIAFLAGILFFVRGQEWNPLLGQAVEAEDGIRTQQLTTTAYLISQ